MWMWKWLIWSTIAVIVWVAIIYGGLVIALITYG